ncbi:unnamed protein product [Rotaria sp. Silwood2]|nr:unnamed protein product [Rotaria sp. Silwood2]
MVGCLKDIYVLLNISRSTTIRPFFHNQHDELRLLIHFLKHSFILHELNNLQLLLDFHNLIFSIILSSSSAVTKSSNISSPVSLNNSLTYIHTIRVNYS